MEFQQRHLKDLRFRGLITLEMDDYPYECFVEKIKKQLQTHAQLVELFESVLNYVDAHEQSEVENIGTVAQTLKLVANGAGYLESEVLDLLDIIEGASKGKGCGKQVIAVARSCGMVDVKGDIQKRLLIKELFECGIRLNGCLKDLFIKRIIGSILQSFKTHNCDVVLREDNRGKCGARILAQSEDSDSNAPRQMRHGEPRRAEIIERRNCLQKAMQLGWYSFDASSDIRSKLLITFSLSAQENTTHSTCVARGVSSSLVWLALSERTGSCRE